MAHPATDRYTLIERTFGVQNMQIITTRAHDFTSPCHLLDSLEPGSDRNVLAPFDVAFDYSLRLRFRDDAAAGPERKLLKRFTARCLRQTLDRASGQLSAIWIRGSRYCRRLVISSHKSAILTVSIRTDT